MEDNVTEAKVWLAKADADLENQGAPTGRADTKARMAQVHATLAVADALDRLLGFLEDRAVTVRSE